MRDPARIDRICGKLAEAWKTVPDWRLMQFMCNIQRNYGNDCFFVEDDVVERIFEFMLEELDEEEEEE